MKSLMDQLKETGLSLPEIEQSLFVIEDWLDQHYPILSRLYQLEILKEVLYKRDDIRSETRNVA